MERRQQTRYKVWFPVQVVADELGALAMTHNVGTGGMLLASPATLVPGQHVKVTFVIPPPSGEAPAQHTLEARVIRVDGNPEDPEGAWPNRIALEFDAVDESLEPLLASAAERISNMP